MWGEKEGQEAWESVMEEWDAWEHSIMTHLCEHFTETFPTSCSNFCHAKDTIKERKRHATD